MLLQDGNEGIAVDARLDETDPEMWVNDGSVIVEVAVGLCCLIFFALTLPD